MITHVTILYRMKKLLLILFYIVCFFFPSTKLYAQSNQTVNNGGATTAVNFAGGCTYNWVNSDPSIGLAASGTGNIPSFTAVNNGKSPVTATITATPSSNGFAYISNFADGTVSVIDIATNKVIKTIPTGNGPEFIAISPDGSRVYVEDTGAGFVSDVVAIDAATNTVISRIQIVDQPSYGLAVSPDGSKLYIGCVGSITNGSVTIVNTSTFGYISTLKFNDVVMGITLNNDGSRLYVTNALYKNIAVVNTATSSVIANIPMGSDPDQVKLSPDGSRLYVSSQNSNNVSVINTVTNKVIATIKVGSSPEGICISADGRRVYVTNTNSNSISIIDATTDKLLSTIAVGINPTGISLSPDGNFLYVAIESSNSVSVIDTKTNTTVGTIPVGWYPFALGSFISAGIGCAQVTFTITVNPKPVITTNAVSGTINACRGTASTSPAIQQFTVSGSNLTAPVTATAPTGFEVSISSTNGYANSLAITPTAGTVSNTIIYVRSSATVAAGNISGNIILSSMGATDQPVAVSGTVNAIPTVNTPGYQILVNGSRTALVNFIGTASTFSWTNDTPGIGLAASGTGDIASFTAVNNTMNPVTATITVTPLNSTGCNGTPIEFTITVNPSPVTLTADGALTPMTTIYGSPSSIERFIVSGTAITSGILITPPAGFEVSLNERDFSPTVTVNGTGNIPATAVFIRLASSTHVGSYNGNVTISAGNTADATIMVPVSTVTRASLTITADNKTRPFGVVNPPLTVTYSGFVNNDSADQLTTLPTVTTDATISSTVGQYAINVIHDATSPDYMFKYNPGILTITPVLSALSIPNTFTPNGDGVNDTWVIQELEYYPKSTMNIFNRWGQKVFTSIGYPIPWDGTYQGKALSSGTYYYIIDPKNGQALLTGWVAIIR